MEGFEKLVYTNVNNRWCIRLIEKNKFSKAIECLNKVIKLDPEDYAAWTFKGIALMYLENYHEAIIAFNKSLEISLNARPWHYKGLCFFKLGDFEKAFKAYDKALQIYPNYPNVWHNKGVSLENLGRHEEALKAYNESLSINSDNFKAWYEKGVSLENLGRHDEALESYKKSVIIKKISVNNKTLLDN
ncbi:MAG: tetratricopeptide repeat protein [Methanobacterium sp.]